MAEIAAGTAGGLSRTSPIFDYYYNEYMQGWHVDAILVVFFLVSLISQIDRMLPLIMAEAIKSDFSLNDTQIGLLTGVAFAVCYTRLSLPLARAADRGSPRFALAACIPGRSAMAALQRAARGGAAHPRRWPDHQPQLKHHPVESCFHRCLCGVQGDAGNLFQHARQGSGRSQYLGQCCGVIAVLCSQDGAWIDGQNVFVNGGIG